MPKLCLEITVKGQGQGQGQRAMNRLAVYSNLTRCIYGHARFGRLFTGHLADNY